MRDVEFNENLTLNSAHHIAKLTEKENNDDDDDYKNNNEKNKYERKKN